MNKDGLRYDLQCLSRCQLSNVRFPFLIQVLTNDQASALPGKKRNLKLPDIEFALNTTDILLCSKIAYLCASLEEKLNPDSPKQIGCFQFVGCIGRRSALL